MEPTSHNSSSGPGMYRMHRNRKCFYFSLFMSFKGLAMFTWLFDLTSRATDFQLRLSVPQGTGRSWFQF